MIIIGWAADVWDKGRVPLAALFTLSDQGEHDAMAKQLYARAVKYCEDQKLENWKVFVFTNRMNLAEAKNTVRQSIDLGRREKYRHSSARQCA